MKTLFLSLASALLLLLSGCAPKAVTPEPKKRETTKVKKEEPQKHTEKSSSKKRRAKASGTKKSQSATLHPSRQKEAKTHTRTKTEQLKKRTSPKQKKVQEKTKKHLNDRVIIPSLDQDTRFEQTKELLLPIKKTQKKLPAKSMVIGYLPHSSRYLLTVGDADTRWVQKAFLIDPKQTLHFNDIQKALEFSAFDPDATLIHLITTQQFLQLQEVSRIGDHLAKKSFWIIIYKSKKELELFKELQFNGLKTALIFLDEAHKERILRQLGEDAVSFKTFTNDYCTLDDACDVHHKGNVFLLY